MMMALANRMGWPSSTTVCFSVRLRAARGARPSGCSLPCSVRRTISASTSTTALSMMMPKSTAPSEIRLAGMPRASSMMKANSSDSGITVATISAARQLPRNTTRIAITSAAPTSRFSPTVRTVWPISSVRS